MSTSKEPEEDVCDEECVQEDCIGPHPKEPEEEWYKGLSNEMVVACSLRLDMSVSAEEYAEVLDRLEIKAKSQGAREALESSMKEIKKEMAEPYDGEFSPEDAFSIVLSILQSNLNKVDNK